VVSLVPRDGHGGLGWEWGLGTKFVFSAHRNQIWHVVSLHLKDDHGKCGGVRCEGYDGLGDGGGVAHVIFPTLHHTSRHVFAVFSDIYLPLFPLDALNIKDPVELLDSYLVREN